MSLDTVKARARREREHDRDFIKSMFQSAFWAVIQSRRADGAYKLNELAAAMGQHKSTVSRWFMDPAPNWHVATMADMARALGVTIEVRLIDNKTGDVFAPHGRLAPQAEPIAALGDEGLKTSNE